jgi:hypothetical protein
LKINVNYGKNAGSYVGGLESQAILFHKREISIGR